MLGRIGLSTPHYPRYISKFNVMWCGRGVCVVCLVFGRRFGTFWAAINADTKMPERKVWDRKSWVERDKKHRRTMQAWTSAHRGKLGQLTPPGKMDEKLKSENMQKEQFSMSMLYFESNQGRQV